MIDLAYYFLDVSACDSSRFDRMCERLSKVLDRFLIGTDFSDQCAQQKERPPFRSEPASAIIMAIELGVKWRVI